MAKGHAVVDRDTRLVADVYVTCDVESKTALGVGGLRKGFFRAVRDAIGLNV